MGITSVLDTTFVKQRGASCASPALSYGSTTKSSLAWGDFKCEQGYEKKELNEVGHAAQWVEHKIWWKKANMGILVIWKETWWQKGRKITLQCSSHIVICCVKCDNIDLLSEQDKKTNVTVGKIIVSMKNYALSMGQHSALWDLLLWTLLYKSIICRYPRAWKTSLCLDTQTLPCQTTVQLTSLSHCGRSSFCLHLYIHFNIPDL